MRLLEEAVGKTKKNVFLYYDKEIAAYAPDDIDFSQWWIKQKNHLVAIGYLLLLLLLLFLLLYYHHHFCYFYYYHHYH